LYFTHLITLPLNGLTLLLNPTQSQEGRSFKPRADADTRGAIREGRSALALGDFIQRSQNRYDDSTKREWQFKERGAVHRSYARTLRREGLSDAARARDTALGKNAPQVSREVDYSAMLTEEEKAELRVMRELQRERNLARKRRADDLRAGLISPDERDGADAAFNSERSWEQAAAAAALKRARALDGVKVTEYDDSDNTTNNSNKKNSGASDTQSPSQGQGKGGDDSDLLGRVSVYTQAERDAHRASKPKTLFDQYVRGREANAILSHSHLVAGRIISTLYYV